ncbi:MAG: alpha/beta fold hydrolase, partial [Treponema sp.]|nr:alpha/beta fold hydrolase [Treponema sp.]
MKKLPVGAAVAAALLMAGCASAARTAETFSARRVNIQGARNNEIPAIVTLPQGKGARPVVLIAHGHGGSKTENGGFDLLAAELAGQGIASLRMDFAGCGDNTEDFTQANRLAYMLDDVAACKAYLGTLAEVDLSRLGILGYSMGGRVAVVAAGRDPDYKTVTLWSPAILPGAEDMYVFMQLSGEEDFMALYDTAKAEGAATYTNAFGAAQTLGLGWFDDMLNINPLTEFSGFAGNLLLITGSEDIIIPTDHARRITTVSPEAREIRWQEIPGADHGYGIYSGETH